VSLPELPRIERVTLARVTKLPDWHPEYARFKPFPVHGWVIRHPEGVILVDTGIGEGNDAIDDWYRPDVVSIEAALASLQLAPRDVTAVVLSHLHFDHCGQQRRLAAPVFVQRAEHHEARRPRYTIAQWAEITPTRLRLVDGDEEIADGVQLLATPGHTPGHQAVVIEARTGRVVLGAQCAFRAQEVSTGEPASTNLHDESWRDAARESLARLRRLGPATVQLSHDPTIVRLS
jgi:glyoxylase-like metal-dependent hydrolase (beta-lactamase superfamily II)